MKIILKNISKIYFIFVLFSIIVLYDMLFNAVIFKTNYKTAQNISVLNIIQSFKRQKMPKLSTYQTKILIFMVDNRPLKKNLENASYNSMTAFVNYLYAKKHGYGFLYYQVKYNNKSNNKNKDIVGCFNLMHKQERAFSHCKLVVAFNLSITQHKNYDLLVFIDSDAIFKNNNLSVLDFISNVKKEDKFIKKYSPFSYVDSNSSSNILFLNNKPWSAVLPCAGFFFINIKPSKNNASEFIKNWWNINVPGNALNHPYEQSLLHSVLNKIKKNISVADSWQFTEVNGQYIRHVTFPDRHLREFYFKKDVKNLEIKTNLSFYNVISFMTKNVFILFDTRANNIF